MTIRRPLFWAPTLAAFVLRLVHLLAMRSNPLFERPIMDALMHDTWARGLLDGTWPGPDPFFRAPLYPYLLGGLYALFDADRFAVQLVHVVISALGAGFAALAAERLWGRRAGWFAGFAYALLWTSIYFSAELLIVTIPVTLNLAALAVLAGGGDEAPGRRRILAAGLLVGLSAIARPNVLIVAPALLLYLRTRHGGRTPWSAWVVLLAGVALPILPVTISNAVRGGDTVLVASQGGVNFYIGNNPDSDGRTAIVPGTRPTWQGGFDDAVAMAERGAGRELKPSEVDRWFVGRGLAYWAEDPGDALRLYGLKLRMLFGAGERSNNKFIYAWRDWSTLLRVPLLVGWPLLLGLAVLGAFIRPAPGGRMLVFGTAGLYALSILLFFVNARFRLPVAAILCIPAGAGAGVVWELIRSRRSAVRPLAYGAAVVALAASLADLADFRERDTDANPFHAFTLGNAYGDLGDDDQALRWWGEALAMQQRRPQVHFALIRDPLYRAVAEARLRKGDTAGAKSTAEAWLRDADGARDPRLWLANLLLETGDTDAAAAQFEFLLRADPNDPEARLGNAWVQYHGGQYGGALRRFRTLARERSDSRAWFGAGLCLINLERLPEAERAFRTVTDLEPGSWQAWGNLAGIYERTGRMDEAREAYGRILRLRPGDARARQWLAENGGQSPGR